MYPTGVFRDKQKTLYIERQKHLEELKRQQEERTAAEQKANEKSHFEKVLDEQKQIRQFIGSVQSGNPCNEQYIIQALKQMCDVLDFLLESNKPEDYEERK